MSLVSHVFYCSSVAARVMSHDGDGESATCEKE
jgi:hypothetical protein